MNRQFIPSTLGEGDYLPSGLFAVSVPGQGIQTNSQLIPLPAGQSALRYPALGSRGQIACQPQNTVSGALVWDPAAPEKGWVADARIPASPNGQIYDNNDFLWINSLGSSYAGSNGYRYVTSQNVVISGDATYAQRSSVAEWTDLSTAQDGSLLIGYAQWTTACILWDGTHHRLIEPLGNHSRVRAHRAGDGITVAVMTNTGCALWSFSVGEISQLPIFEQSAPPVDQPVGPTTPPATGTDLYDIVEYIHCDPSLQPRVGLTNQPTDTQHQIEMADTHLWHHSKFANPPSYETWGWDDLWTYHLEDASGDPPYSFSIPNWWPRHLQVGIAHGYITGDHVVIHRQRVGCAVIDHEPINRNMWLLAAYPGYYWGKDLGNRPTLVLVYDDTAGIHNSGRFIELFYFAKNAGWCRWEAHRSDLVYATGQPVFTDSTRVDQSNFYLVGGPAIVPALTGCVPQVVPTPPPHPQPPRIIMLYIFLNPNSFVVQKCNRIDNGDGTVSAQRVTDNQFLSRDSAGNITWKPTVAGGDERFLDNGKALLSENLFPDNAHATYYAFPYEAL